MPDDDRPRRRLGDETKGRIADLASGWSLDSSSKDQSAPEPPRAKAPTAPPPPARPKAPTAPPPLPPAARAKAPTAPPAPRASTGPIKPIEAPRTKPPTAPPPPRAATGSQPVVAKSAAAAQVAKDLQAPVATEPPKRPPKPSNSSMSATSSGTIGPIRTKPSTAPPPVPARSKSASVPPQTGVTRSEPGLTGARQTGATRSEPRQTGATRSEPAQTGAKSGPQFPRAGFDGPRPPLATAGLATPKSFAAEPVTPAVIVDDALTIPDPVAPAPPIRPQVQRPPLLARASTPGPKLAVPVGEFDSGVQTLDDAGVRAQAQATIKRDAAEALLKIPDRETPVEDLLEDERGDPTTIDSQTTKFERGDPTQDGEAGGGRIKQASGGTLRASAALRRKRGLAGDVRYVFTALFGVRASRREAAELDHRQELRQTSRRRHLVTLGRTAVITDTFDHPAMSKAREQLQAIEDERSVHAGAVAASDAELERVRRDRDAKAKQFASDVAAAEKELAELTKKLEPLEKAAATARKRAQELRESLRRIDKRIAETEALFTSVKGEKMDRAAIEADLATHKADRQSVLRDEPVIAGELDALEPRIAAIQANRSELRKKRGELDKAEAEDQRRAMELLDAIAAKRKVVERASADAEVARDSALFELGEQLYVDRPKTLNAQLSPIDQIDLELGEGDRRLMELREILSNIDKAKFARGMAMIVLVLGVVGTFLVWILANLL